MNLAENGFDFQAAEKKITELQKFKTALSYEISQNQARAEELNTRIKFLEEKIEEHKQLKGKVLSEVEAKISESEELSKKLRLQKIEYEHQKNDTQTEKRNIEADRNTLSLERSNFKERSELREEQLARREQAVLNDEKNMGYKVKEVEAKMDDLYKREEKIKELEKNAQATFSSSEVAKKEADMLKAEAQKFMDEALAMKSLADEKFLDINRHREDLLSREKSMKLEIRSLEEEKVKFKQDKRDLEMEANKLVELRNRLRREIDNARVEDGIKKEMKEELNENPNQKTV